MPRDVPPPSPPYLGPARWQGDANNKPIRRVVIHSTVSPCEPGGARNIAAYFRHTDRPSSAHYVVDPGEVVQVVFDGVVVYHAPPNQHSLGVELCEFPVANSAARWKGQNHQDMLRRAARLTARLCAAYGIPPRYVSARGLRRGRNGVTTHAQVGEAWGQTDHWDPGAWPRRRFMRMVRRYYRQLRSDQ